MRSTSKVIMGATLIMVISLAIILGLLLVLLAELYCSLLLRRRQLQHTSATTPTTASTANSAVVNPMTISTSSTQPPPLNSFYSQGVLSAPRSFLFPKLSIKEDKTDVENNPHRSQLRQFLEESPVEYSINSPHRIGLLSSFPSSPSFMIPLTSPPQPPKIPRSQPFTTAYVRDDSHQGCNVSKDKFMYISNPIYDNDGAGPLKRVADTPFETPNTSPSRLDTISGSSGDDEENNNAGKSCFPTTPPLTPMKKLPAQACSVTRTDARSLNNSSITDSNSHNNGETSSSSGSPRTSPSW